jgi:LytS/YehU family sensor histidine kinase
VKTTNDYLLKVLPFILAIILPSIDYFNNTDNGSSGEAFIRWFFISLTLLGIWYLNVFILEYKAITILVINIVFIGILILLSYIFYPDRFSSSIFPRIILPAILFVAIQQSFKSVQEKQLLLTENLQLKSETYKAELENLRSQVNPHFLFNSLATLQSIVRQNPKTAEDFIIKLSDFYRRTLLSSPSNKITLKEELEFIQSYIFLLQNRFENGLKFKIDINEATLKYNLPTFALQILIENCIKHNIISDEKPLIIHLFQKDMTSITVQNNSQIKLNNEGSTKTGLLNLKRRYELYGIKDGVIIDQNKDDFSATLKLF